MQEEQFNFIRGFLMERSGLAIDRQKTYLLKSRLQPMIRQHALLGLDELVDRIKAGDRRLSQLLVEAMVTSETLFFRDGYPFDALCDLFLPGISATGHVIRIWSAAAASGQEPYSIAMSIAEKAPDIIPRLEIVATDISRTALKKAMSGQYTHMEVQRGLSSERLERFFEHEREGWSVKENIRNMVCFKQTNLIADDLPGRVCAGGNFDIVFCRNVLIYFDMERRRRVLDNISRCMSIGGFLLTGAAENAEGRLSKWERVPFGDRSVWRLMVKA